MQTFSTASYWAINERGRNGRTNSGHREDTTGVPYRHNNGEVEMAIREQLRMQLSSFYRNGNVSRFQNWDKCINVLEDYAEM